MSGKKASLDSVNEYRPMLRSAFGGAVAWAVPLTVFGLRASNHSVAFVRASLFDPPGDLRFQLRPPSAERYLLKFDPGMDIVFPGLKKPFKPIGVMTFVLVSPFLREEKS